MPDVDVSELIKLSKRDQRERCPIPDALKRLKAADRKIVASGFAHERVKVGGIVKFLEARGIKVSIPAVTSHRADRCSCND